MKAVITLVFILLVSLSAQAQDASQDASETIKNINTTEVSIQKENQVVRLYMNKNHRIVKALSFSTKKNKSKLA